MSNKNTLFRFKQFAVDQAGCAMKINTDGVLLGAMAAADDAKRILDVGTGTGVIALMMAQRYGNSRVEAVEVDAAAAERAALNFSVSAFSERMIVHHADIRSFEAEPFDLVVSNPPYFSNDLKNPDARKQLARHAEPEFFESLFISVGKLLNPDGLFWLIIPAQQALHVKAAAAQAGLNAVREIAVQSDDTRPVIRKILVFSHQQQSLQTDVLHIYEEHQRYSAAYRLLLADFLLAL
ncbi:tRNA1(Val) (adenine(37)-N6)-methyltransferase [Pedobacter sp. SYP-B3415]|uniref:tRNA1(Val) (adenine(37)-N6)-methyltransferase n=1 Tax=Pedobacter sp. SYP-B3415 TaxID=2496641 RepID=UPI00101D2F11|nr:methyltransferase [Pedobacter sp. SYP-B3415]